jgi:nucleotidyltransferase substrate binding protein (TIGR01987 family)
MGAPTTPQPLQAATRGGVRLTPSDLPPDRVELRWRQRLDSLQRALRQLQAALAAHASDPDNEVIGMAVIKAYEFSFELGWKTLKDLLAYEGIDAPLPRQVIREAFAANLVRNGQIWIDMLEQRNLMAHTYDIQRAQRALTMIQGSFAPALLELARDLEDRP